MSQYLASLGCFMVLARLPDNWRRECHFAYGGAIYDAIYEPFYGLFHEHGHRSRCVDMMRDLDSPCSPVRQTRKLRFEILHKGSVS